MEPLCCGRLNSCLLHCLDQTAFVSINIHSWRKKLSYSVPSSVDLSHCKEQYIMRKVSSELELKTTDINLNYLHRWVDGITVQLWELQIFCIPTYAWRVYCLLVRLAYAYQGVSRDSQYFFSVIIIVHCLHCIVFGSPSILPSYLTHTLAQPSLIELCCCHSQHLVLRLFAYNYRLGTYIYCLTCTLAAVVHIVHKNCC